MNFINKITGKDITQEFKTFEKRVEKLPLTYQRAWEEIKSNLWLYSDFSGRNLMPIMEGIVEMLEVTNADNLSIDKVFDGDISGFCKALANEEGAKDVRDKWRHQLNKAVATKLEDLE